MVMACASTTQKIGSYLGSASRLTQPRSAPSQLPTWRPPVGCIPENTLTVPDMSPGANPLAPEPARRPASPNDVHHEFVPAVAGPGTISFQSMFVPQHGIRLVWPGRGAPRPAPPAELRPTTAGDDRIRLLQGDNHAALAALSKADTRATLVYLDPPFFTGREHTLV